MGGLTSGDVVDLVGGDFTGDRSLPIERVRTLAEAGPNDLSFLGNPKYVSQVGSSLAGAIIVGRRQPEESPRFIRVDDPYVALARVLTRWFEPAVHPKGVSELAFISPSASLGHDVAIGPFAVIGDEVVIGDGAAIHEGVSIGAGSEIGEGTVLYPRAVVYPRMKIGRRCIIHSGAVIGSDGFGFVTTGGRHLKIPQIGIVRLEDDVEIGACTTIDRAALAETVIGEGSKLDNLVQIAHNVRIGRHGLFASQAGVAGSTTFGDYCVMAGQAGSVGHIELGDHVVIVARGVATKNWEGPVQLAGFPGRPIGEKMRADASAARLPKLTEKIRGLEERVAQLEKLLAHRSPDEESES
jgi:UDP-3-O-[3-hydroxymyristoyl] glucosamine N-acyltransferase